nr:MAG TPA: hypothetical protein [Caudoviricetes sp.]
MDDVGTLNKCVVLEEFYEKVHYKKDFTWNFRCAVYHSLRSLYYRIS